MFHLDRIDLIFNFTRPITFKHIIQRIKAYAISNNASYPWKTDDRALGLWSEINHEGLTGDYKPTYHENFVTDGSSYRFHSPFELPFYRTNEHISEIHKKTQFLVTPQISYLGDSLMDENIERRQCYFTSEKELQTFKVYTKINCIQECVTNATLKTCGCVQFFMPHKKALTVCSIHDQKCTNSVESRSDFESACECLPLCEDIKYSVEQRQTDKASVKSWGTQQHGSIITVQFEKDEFYPTIRQRQFTGIHFISYIGGTLGLFAGFSLLTVFELLSHFVVRTGLGWFKKMRNQKKVQPIGRHALVKSVKLMKALKCIIAPLSFCQSYVENSSVHGINHAAQKNMSLLERILWLTLFVASIGFSWVLVAQTYRDYRDAPILLSIDSKIHQIQSIPFPAITISQERATSEKFFTFLVYMLFWREEDVIYYFNQSGYDEFYAQEMICLQEDVIFRNFEYKLPDMVERIKNESDADRFSQHRSSWNSVQRPVFIQIPTKYGFSFTFNLLGSENMFKKSISSDFHFASSAITTLPLRNAVKKTNPKLYPLNTGAESADGLEVVMYKERRTDLNICREASFTLHSPFELPSGYDFSDYCDFDYQKVVTVSIIPEVIFTDDSLRSIDPAKRNCFFDGEKELKYFRTYTKNNCEMECLSKLTLDICNCTTFYFVREESTPLCYMNDHKYIRYKASPKSLRYCGCLESCNLVNYRFEVRSDRLTTDYNPNSTDEVVFRFRFKESEFMPTLRHQPFTFVDFLAQAGGLLGLFVCASFLSVVEIFYFFTLRLFVNICRSYRKAGIRSAWAD